MPFEDPHFIPSTIAERLRALSRRRLADEDHADEDSGTGDQAHSGSDGDFIVLDGGRMFVRKFEVVGMRWERYFQEEEECHRLRVFFSDCPAISLYGEDARNILGAFGLPKEPPR